MTKIKKLKDEKDLLKKKAVKHIGVVGSVYLVIILLIGYLIDQNKNT